MKNHNILILFYSFLICGFIFGATGCADKIGTPASSGANLRGNIAYENQDNANPVSSQKPMEFLTNSDGSNPQPLGNKFVTGSANGKMLYLTGDTVHGLIQFGISNNDGSNSLIFYQLPMVTSPSLSSFPIISPDASHIAFTLQDSGSSTCHLYVMPTNSGNVQEISKNVDPVTQYTFSPDGNSIAYYTGTQSTQSDIELAHLDGTIYKILIKVANPGLENQGAVAWSSDGIKIAYVDFPTLYSINTDGSQRQRVADSGLYPAWSRFGDSLAYEGSTGDIIMTPDLGITKIDLTNTPLQGEKNPQWSPDDKQILCLTWTGDIDQATLSLRLINVAAKTSSIIASPAMYPVYLN